MSDIAFRDAGIPQYRHVRLFQVAHDVSTDMVKPLVHFPVLVAGSMSGDLNVIKAGNRIGPGPEADISGREVAVASLDHQLVVYESLDGVACDFYFECLPIAAFYGSRTFLDA